MFICLLVMTQLTLVKDVLFKFLDSVSIFNKTLYLDDITLALGWNVLKTVIKNRLWFLSKVKKSKSNLCYLLQLYFGRHCPFCSMLFKYNIPRWMSSKEKVHHSSWTHMLLMQLRFAFVLPSRNIRASSIFCSITLALLS